MLYNKISIWYPFNSRVVGRATCGWWTMPPNMEKFYDPKFDLGDEEDKERFHIYFSLAFSRILIPDSGI